MRECFQECSLIKEFGNEANFDDKYTRVVEIDETSIGFSKKKAITPFGNKKIDGFHGHFDDNVSSNVKESKNLESEVNFNGKYKGVVETDGNPYWIIREDKVSG